MCVAAAAGFVLGVFGPAAGVSRFGRPEGGADVSGPEVRRNAAGARGSTLRRQRPEPGSDRPGAARQTHKDQKEMRECFFTSPDSWKKAESSGSADHFLFGSVQPSSEVRTNKNIVYFPDVTSAGTSCLNQSATQVCILLALSNQKAAFPDASVHFEFLRLPVQFSINI